MFEACSITESIVCDIENMIGFGIREMELQEMQIVVKILIKCEIENKRMDQADAAEANPFRLAGNLVANIAGREDVLAICWEAILKPRFDPSPLRLHLANDPRFGLLSSPSSLPLLHPNPSKMKRAIYMAVWVVWREKQGFAHVLAEIVEKTSKTSLV